MNPAPVFAAGRRIFSPQFKLEVLAQAQGADKQQVKAILQEYQLWASYLKTWQRQQLKGKLGPTPVEKFPVTPEGASQPKAPLQEQARAVEAAAIPAQAVEDQSAADQAAPAQIVEAQSTGDLPKARSLAMNDARSRRETVQLELERLREQNRELHDLVSACSILQTGLYSRIDALEAANERLEWALKESTKKLEQFRALATR